MHPLKTGRTHRVLIVMIMKIGRNHCQSDIKKQNTDSIEITINLSEVVNLFLFACLLSFTLSFIMIER